MNRLFFILIFLLPCIFIFSQDNLSKKEQFFLSPYPSQGESNKVILPQDTNIGLMEVNGALIGVIEDFILNGPAKNNSLVSMIQILDVKRAPLAKKTVLSIRIAKNNILGDRYESDFKVVYDNENITGTIYLLKIENKWFIEDLEIK